MEELKNVKGFLQQVSDAFAAVLDVELAIIDAHLEVIAGTGRYKKEVGLIYNQGCMTDHLVNSIIEESCILIEDTEASDYCCECENQGSCGVLAFSMCPIPYRGRKLGTISLLALNEFQKQVLIRDYKKLINFLQRVSSFIVTTLNEKEMRAQLRNLALQIETIINSVHEGIVAINEEGMITNINDSARKMLYLQRDMKERYIEDLFPDFNYRHYLDGRQVVSNPTDYYEKEIEYDSGGNTKLRLFCNISLQKREDRVVGAVISFVKSEEIKKLATKIMGQDIPALDAIQGISNEITELKKQLKRVTRTDSTILLRGETGTGKNLFANAIHEESERKNKPFITVNCAALPGSLLESELFGYEEGAFTGAKRGGKPGKFELAHQGTILLDEAGDIPLSFQVKLLEVIETGKIERIGGVQTREIDVRMIAATNQDLETLIEKKRFRKDLFYRLNVIPIHIPPLRERKDDINLLMHFFLDYFAHKLKKNINRFDPRTKEILLGYNWPGNVRELKNTIEYAVNIETKKEISLASLPKRILASKHNESFVPVHTLDYLEKRAIIHALKKYGNSTQGKEKAAQALGISRATLYRKMKTFQLK